MFAANLNNVKASPTYEDFTTYTEVDPNNHLSKTANHIDFKACYNEDCYLYKDEGANHFGSVWEHKIDVTAIDRYGNSPAIFMGLANAIDDWAHAGNEVGVYIYYSNGAASYRIYLFEYYSSTEYFQAYSISVSTSYYLTIKKDGTALTCKIYSDSARTILLATLSLTLHADESYQYIYAAQTSNMASTAYTDVDIDNLDLSQKEWFLSETWQTTIHVWKWFLSETWQTTIHVWKWFLGEAWLLINIYVKAIFAKPYGIYTIDYFPSFVFFMFVLSIVITFICVFPVYRRRGKK